MSHPEWTDAHPPVIGEPLEDEGPIIRGGQGRTHEQATHNAEGVSMFWTMVVVIAFLAVVAVGMLAGEWGDR